jgi:hypothetical protein
MHWLRRKIIKAYVRIRHKVKDAPGDLRIWWFTIRHPVEFYRTLQLFDRAIEAREALDAEEAQNERERLDRLNNPEKWRGKE